MIICPTCGKMGGHGRGICPNRLSVPERKAQKEAERRERAEQIARQTLDRINAAAAEEFGTRAEITDANPHALQIATLAALAALTESEARP